MNQFKKSKLKSNNNSVSNKIALSQFPFSIKLHSSISSIDNWNTLAPNNIFLQKEYLELVEKNPPEGMRFCYTVFYKLERPIGIALFQIIHFNADKSLQQADKNNPCFFHTFSNFFKGLLAKNVDFYTLVNGNLLLTGEHGFYFNPKEVSEAEGFELLEDAVKKVIPVLKKERKIHVSLSLFKDYHETSTPQSRKLITHQCSEFTIQPNLMMELREDWKSYDDYLAAMLSKYRTRAKRAAKKGANFRKVEFDEAMIIQYQKRIYELYCLIAKSVGFNVLRLSFDYFLGLKQTFKDKFHLIGYFDKDRLVGFYTVIENEEELEAHFLGFEQEYNPTCQIYLNILYDIVKWGIELESKRIVFARTATEIKSSVGAVPHEMYCYMRHSNNFSNRFLNPILDYLKPKEEWKQRHPFKEEVKETVSS